jgi:hypothetical protein
MEHAQAAEQKDTARDRADFHDGLAEKLDWLSRVEQVVWFWTKEKIFW